MERRQVCLDVAQARGRLTSVVGAVFHRYGVVWAGSSGAGPGLSGQYRIGSITKTMTAVLVMQARDAGMLTLDDPIGRHLGDVGYAEATIRDLLSHTSGAQSEPAGPWWERSRGGDFAALAATNDGSGRVAGPREFYHYSNLGYGLLGEVLDRVTGRPWRRLVHEVLLTPLGMSQTSYLPRPHAQPGWSVDHFTGHPDVGAAGQHGGHGPGRPAVVDRPRPGHVGPVPGRRPPRPARTRRRCTRCRSRSPTAMGSGCGSPPTPAACWSVTAVRCPASWRRCSSIPARGSVLPC